MQQAIPTSTIVLAVMTCIPFALAIKDTASGKYAEIAALEQFGRDHDRYRAPDAEPEEEDYRDVARRRAMEEAESRLRIIEQERQDALDREKVESQIRALYGAEVASLGPSFENIKLGETAPKAVELAAGFTGELRGLAGPATTLEIEIFARVASACTTLGTKLRETWGEPAYVGSKQSWVNQPAGQRATFLRGRGSCHLTFEKVAPLVGWLDKTRTSLVPMWAVGQPATALRAHLDSRAVRTTGGDAEITWIELGLEIGDGPTQLIAYVERGMVVGVLASLELDAVALETVVARVGELTGKQPQDEDSLIWKSNPPIEIKTGSQTSLLVGRQPK